MIGRVARYIETIIESDSKESSYKFFLCMGREILPVSYDGGSSDTSILND